MTHRSTGQVAGILRTTEPRVAETVRRGKVKPPPQIVAGRRLWLPHQVLQAARALHLDQDEVQRRLDREEAPPSKTGRSRG